MNNLQSQAFCQQRLQTPPTNSEQLKESNFQIKFARSDIQNKITMLENQIISNQYESSSEIYKLKQQIQSSNQTIIQLEQQLSAKNYEYMVDIQQLEQQLQYEKNQLQFKSKSNEYQKNKNDQLKMQLGQCEKFLMEATDKIKEKEVELMEMEEKNQQQFQIIILLKNQIFIQQKEIERYKEALQS